MINFRHIPLDAVLVVNDPRARNEIERQARKAGRTDIIIFHVTIKGLCCPNCEGAGHIKLCIVPRSQYRIRACSVCKGAGRVSEVDAHNYFMSR